MLSVQSVDHQHDHIPSLHTNNQSRYPNSNLHPVYICLDVVQMQSLWVVFKGIHCQIVLEWNAFASCLVHLPQLPEVLGQCRIMMKSVWTVRFLQLASRCHPQHHQETICISKQTPCLHINDTEKFEIWNLWGGCDDGMGSKFSIETEHNIGVTVSFNRFLCFWSNGFVSVWLGWFGGLGFIS